MKKIILTLVCIILLGVASSCNQGKTPAPIVKNGITYQINKDRGGYTIISVDTELTEISIPAVLNILPVSVIGKNAFKDSKASVIKMTNSIKEIQDNAFQNCKALEEIFISNKVVTMGIGVFKNASSLKSVIFEEESILDRIQKDTFYGCTSLTKLQLPPRIRSIGERAFYKCTSLEEIAPILTLGVIDSSAFEGCTNLKTFYLNRTISVINPRAFYKCTNLHLQCESPEANSNWREDWNLLLEEKVGDKPSVKTYLSSITWNVPRG